jgi:hypothetical protein
MLVTLFFIVDSKRIEFTELLTDSTADTEQLIDDRLALVTGLGIPLDGRAA